MKPHAFLRSSFFLGSLCLLAAAGSFAQASPIVPGKPQDHPIALIGATVHPVSGPVIAGGVVLFDGGKIVAVGPQVKLPEGVEKIDVAGKHVYPGLFDAYTNLGLVEIGAVRASNDRSETGRINPNVKANVAFNPDSELTPVARSGGVLTVVAAPSGGLISGVSAVMQLDGWTWEDMTLHSAGMHLNWPRAIPVRAWWNEETAKQQLAKRKKDLAEIRQALADARAYLGARNSIGKPGVAAARFDSRWEAMIPLLQRKLPLIVHADEVSQIQDAVAFAAREKVRLIIYGGYDAPECVELLRKHNVSVIVAGVHRLPRRRHDEYDAPFTVPARLKEAGVPFCISGAEWASNVRNLPHHAATAAAYGLSRDEALRSITLSPAEILGVANRIGSLRAGKDATLIVTDGDILEITTHVQIAYLGGRKVDLTDKQKLLWKKYQEKYRRQEAKR